MGIHPAILRRRSGGGSLYTAGGINPPFVADFGAEYYRATGRTTFANAITHTRASNATMVDSTGTLVTVGPNVPRIGHHVWNGSAWVNEGLLHESEARTNLLTYSEDLNNSVGGYTEIGCSPVLNYATGPDGETSATRLIDNSGGGTGNVFLQRNITVLTSSTYTFSLYAKADQLSWVALGVVNFTTPASGQTFFDLSSGAVGTVSSGVVGQIENVGNGWHRCSVTFTTDAADTTGNLQILAADGNGDITVDLDGTSSILIYGAQLEEGSTPSSYIPTNGSTATRAAETLTIPSANLPWPTPRVIGEELVTNGDFGTGDLSNWIIAGTDGTHSVTYSSGGARYQSDTTSPLLSLSQSNVMTVGKVYQVTVETTAYTSGSLKTDSLSGTNVVSNGLGTITFVGVASSTALVIVRNSSNVDITIDNFSVREIDPLAVSIQMEGRMTYADTDTAFEVVPYSWYLNSSNQILQYTRTDLASPIMQFRQYANGVSDVVTSPSVNTGILVPFNIASRHGSTFINGAVSGTALTEDTTPTALPDLSATDLELGYDFMGTIKTFRIWAADLGDTGIAEASS